MDRSYLQIVDLFLRSSTGGSSNDSDHVGSGSGHDVHSGHDEHAGTHPGTVLFLFVAIAVGGEQKLVSISLIAYLFIINFLVYKQRQN